MKLKAVYFNGSYPVPGFRTVEQWFEVKGDLTVEERAYGIIVSNGKVAYFQPWTNIAYFKYDLGCAPTPVTDINTAKKAKPEQRA